MVTVTLRLVARPATREELRRRVHEMLFAPTRAEPGCITYRFYQDTENAAAFSFVEEWESWEALNDHFRSAHVSAFLAGLGELLAEPPVARFHEIASTRGLEALEEARAQVSA